MDTEKIPVILGHHNYGIALILEYLYEKFDSTDIFVRIIENTDPKNSSIYHFPFAANETRIEKLKANDWKPQDDELYFNSAVSPWTRRSIYNFFKKEFEIDVQQYGNVIHSSSEIARTAQLSQGHYIAPKVVTSPFNQLGDMVYVNRACTLGHHTILEDFVSLCPGTNIASNVRIRKNTLIYTGCTIFDNVEIGENTVIGAASLVTESLPANVIAYGNPAKVVRQNNRVIPSS